MQNRYLEILDFTLLLANALEDCNYTKGDKLVEVLLIAKALAEKIGGKAILELI